MGRLQHRRPGPPGRPVRTGKGLRYRIPFGEVDEVLGYLREHATDDGSRLGTMGDDGEKFGAWPTTWDHCWGEGRWMERFFEALEAEADWLHTTTPSDWLAEHAPLARVYVPAARTPRWANGPSSRTKPRRTATPCAPTWPKDGPSRAGCTGPPGATSSTATARSTTSTSRCCGRRPRWRRSRRDRSASAPRTSCSAARATIPYWHGLFGQQILDILIFNLPIVRFVFTALVLLLLAPPIAFVIIYMEMKVIALMNLRIGPDRVGPWGSLLSTVHGLKVLMKEDFTPTRADAVVFTWAPVVVFAAAALSALVLPFAPGLYGQNFNLGAAVLLRHRRHDRGRAADGRLVELQQVLAAGRPSLGGTDRQLRDPAHAVGRRGRAPRRDDEPQLDRQAGAAGSPTGTWSASRSAS